MSRLDVAIIGGGISGLSALHFIRQMRPELSVALFEAEGRLGGTIGTDKIDGYSFDWGPNGFLDREPLTLQLCDELGLKDSLERAGENVSKRFILRDGKLRAVPMSPASFILSDILNLSGRLRLLMEPFAKSRTPGVDESIYDFVARRIGVQAADYLVQPMVSGIYGGLAEKLSLESCFPIMRTMEDEYGSLFKAMIAKAKQAKAKKKKTGSPSGPAGWLTSFEGGLYKLIERFEERYSEYITKATTAFSIDKDDDGYHVNFKNHNSIKATRVIIAVPSYIASSLVQNISSELTGTLKQIEYAPISVVSLGYERKKVGRPLDGFGFLVPSKEKRKILGSIWTSSIFKNRAPKGEVQLRTMIGGDGDHQSHLLSDNNITDLARTDLDPILKIETPPKISRIYRWEQGIPQFKIGHSVIMKEIEEHSMNLGNIYLTGNAYDGIGLNDCVKRSHKIVSNLK